MQYLVAIARPHGYVSWWGLEVPALPGCVASVDFAHYDHLEGRAKDVIQSYLGLSGRERTGDLDLSPMVDPRYAGMLWLVVEV